MSSPKSLDSNFNRPTQQTDDNDTRISPVEASVMIEEVVGAIRHKIRNNLAAIQNASFYLRRKVSSSNVWTEDPRVPQFFRLIEEQLTSAVDAIGTAGVGSPYQRHVTRVAVGEAIKRGIAARSADTNLDLWSRTHVSPGDAIADANELAFAVEKTLQYCEEHCAGQAPEIEGEQSAREYLIRLRTTAMSDTSPSPPWPPQLALARRVVVNSGGRFGVQIVGRMLEIELGLLREMSE